MPSSWISGSEVSNRKTFMEECLQMTLRIVDGYLCGALDTQAHEQMAGQHAQSN